MNFSLTNLEIGLKIASSPFFPEDARDLGNFVSRVFSILEQTLETGLVMKTSYCLGSNHIKSYRADNRKKLRCRKTWWSFHDHAVIFLAVV